MLCVSVCADADSIQFVVVKIGVNSPDCGYTGCM